MGGTVGKSSGSISLSLCNGLSETLSPSPGLARKRQPIFSLKSLVDIVNVAYSPITYA